MLTAAVDRVAAIAGARVAIDIGALNELAETYSRMARLVDSARQIVVARPPVDTRIGNAPPVGARAAATPTDRSVAGQLAAATAACALVADGTRIAIVARRAAQQRPEALTLDTRIVAGAGLEIVADLSRSDRKPGHQDEWQ